MASRHLRLILPVLFVLAVANLVFAFMSGWGWENSGAPAWYHQTAPLATASLLAWPGYGLVRLIQKLVRTFA